MLLPELDGRESAQAVVGYFPFVVDQPPLGLVAHVAQVAEDMHVQHAATEATVEAFDETVLHGAPRLDKVELDALSFGPLGKDQGNKLRAVVQAKLRRVTAPGRYPLQRADNARRG